MIITLSIADFQKPTGQVYYTEDEATITLYKVTDEGGGVVFKNVYEKKSPEDDIMFAERYMPLAIRAEKVEKDITITVL